MTRHAVLTAIGVDRPGLVDEVTRFVLERGGNLEDSRMVNLHGQFGILMLIAGPDEVVERLRDDLAAFGLKSGLHAELTEADMGVAGSRASAVPYRLHVSGMDHPGLVQSVAHVLRGMDVNIESADTMLQQAPITGAPVFEMEFVVSVPADTSVAGLRDSLGILADELNIDWQLTAF